jgi:hypothetical protein
MDRNLGREAVVSSALSCSSLFIRGVGGNLSKGPLNTLLPGVDALSIGTLSTFHFAYALVTVMLLCVFVVTIYGTGTLECIL